MSIGDTERTTQNRVIDFFKNRNILDYKYIGNLKDRANKNIREDRLRAYLHLSGYSERLIDGAVSELIKAADDMTHGLYVHLQDHARLRFHGIRQASIPYSIFRLSE